MSVLRPEKLVPGKYNIVAVNRDFAAILWKDGEFFIISTDHQSKILPVSEMKASSIEVKGGFVHPEPIPLENLSEWRERAKEIDIPILSTENQTLGRL